MSEELEVLDLPLSSIFKEKRVSYKKERALAGFAGIEPGPLAQESLGYLPEPSASWRMQVEKDRSRLKSFRWLHARITGTRTTVASARCAQARRKKKHPSKMNKPRTTIIYTMEREAKVIDSESCVNVREWCARVNMGDRLLSMLVRMCAVCVFEQCEISNKRLLLTQDRF